MPANYIALTSSSSSNINLNNARAVYIGAGNVRTIVFSHNNILSINNATDATAISNALAALVALGWVNVGNSWFNLNQSFEIINLITGPVLEYVDGFQLRVTATELAAIQAASLAGNGLGSFFQNTGSSSGSAVAASVGLISSLATLSLPVGRFLYTCLIPQISLSGGTPGSIDYFCFDSTFNGPGGIRNGNCNGQARANKTNAPTIARQFFINTNFGAFCSIGTPLVAVAIGDSFSIEVYAILNVTAPTVITPAILPNGTGTITWNVLGCTHYAVPLVS